MAQKRTRTLDTFQIVAELGRGAASRILHVRDPESFQHFAMKVVVRQTSEEQKFLDQAKNEFEVARKFDHPALVKFYDIRIKKRWFREREVRTLIEYVNGSTLEQLQGLSVPALAVILHEAAQAVAYMHRRSVFHADLKPNNIMVSESGQVKVIDFGLAWLRGQQKNRVQGTMGYLAPEQIRDRTVTAQTDVYNMGATMYRMLTGRPSATPDRPGANYIPSSRILNPPHEVNPEVPLELSTLVMQCCEAKPRKRPASMAAVAQSLGKICKSLGVSAESLPELLRREKRTQ